MKRLQTEVIDMKPDLVIWQVGTNAVLRNLDPGRDRQAGRATASRGSRRRAPISCWSIRNILRRVNERAQSASQMVRLLGKVAELRHVGIFSALRGDARMA